MKRAIDACQSVLCKSQWGFAVDDRDVNIQEGNGRERVIARELYSGTSFRKPQFVTPWWRKALPFEISDKIIHICIPYIVWSALLKFDKLMLFEVVSGNKYMCFKRCRSFFPLLLRCTYTQFINVFVTIRITSIWESGKAGLWKAAGGNLFLIFLSLYVFLRYKQLFSLLFFQFQCEIREIESWNLAENFRTKHAVSYRISQEKNVPKE